MTNPENNKIDNFAKYTGMAFQMLITIGIFMFIGSKIDEQYPQQQPLYTALSGLVGVIISLYMIIRSLTKK